MVKISVLHIDDELHLFGPPVKKIAKAFGFDLVSVSSLKEALEITSKRKFNLVICDPAVRPVKRGLDTIYSTQFLLECEKNFHARTILHGRLLIGNKHDFAGFNYVDKAKPVDLIDFFKKAKEHPTTRHVTKVDHQLLAQPVMHITTGGKKSLVRVADKLANNPVEMDRFRQGYRTPTKTVKLKRLRKMLGGLNRFDSKPLPGSALGKMDARLKRNIDALEKRKKNGRKRRK